MMLSKLALPRRTFLRGMGATLALPFLDAMVPAMTAMARTAAQPVRRLGFMYVPNGATMASWIPSSQGEGFELPPTLRPLEPFKKYVFVPSGLDQKEANAKGDGNGEHTRAAAAWLSGMRPKHTEGADVQLGITADQLAAQELGKTTLLPSLEIALEQNYLVGNCDNGYSCAYWNTMAWRTPTTPLPMQTNPRVVFETMFGDAGTPAERLAEIGKDRSILDWVMGDVARLDRTLGNSDRTRVSQYLESLREVERRIQAAERQNGESVLALPKRPVGIPETFQEHARLMFDLLLLAYQADITRVFTFQLGREQSNRPYPEVGVPESHHSISHHQHQAVKFAQHAKINTFHIEQLAYFVNKLQATPDGDGSLLDHVLLLHGSGISDGDAHRHEDLPLVMAGGGAGRLKGGRHVRYNAQPMSNLLLGILDKVDVRVDHLGDSTGRLDPLAL